MWWCITIRNLAYVWATYFQCAVLMAFVYCLTASLKITQTHMRMHTHADKYTHTCRACPCTDDHIWINRFLNKFYLHNVIYSILIVLFVNDYTTYGYNCKSENKMGGGGKPSNKIWSKHIREPKLNKEGWNTAFMMCSLHKLILEYSNYVICVKWKSQNT